MNQKEPVNESYGSKRLLNDLSKLSNSKYVRSVFNVLSHYEEVNSIVELCQKIALVEDISPGKVHYGRVHEAVKEIVSKTSLVERVETKKGQKKIKVRLIK